ncbi:MAG: STAS domain-containing protein [Chloroflexales bacterium]|nr:STAS domain-containing protein [Chloroflexales bacterium]
MSKLFAALTSIKAEDPDLRRRGQNVLIISAGMAVLLLGLIPVAFRQGAPPVAPVIQAVASLVFLGTAMLARSGRVSLAAFLAIAVSIVINLTLIIIDPNTPSLPFFLALAILLATVLLPPIHIWSVLMVCLLGSALAISFFSPERRADELWGEAITNSSVLMVAVAVVGYLSASGVRVALRQAQDARAEAEAANGALAASNAVLEARVEERTSALRQIADEHRAAAAELKASLQAQQELNRLVADLAVPVIPISAGTLVVPLVGSIDSLRADQILATILTQVERSRARTVVLDVTGVAVVDTHVAAALLRVAQATRLMGADAVLAGIRPEVAQALVGLGVDLSDLHTVATLQEIERL